MSQRSKNIGAICYRKAGGSKELSFREILLDERVLVGDIYIRKEVLSAVGGINIKLDSKRNYELVLRVAKRYRVVLSEVLPHEGWVKMEKEKEEGLETDCYLIARYKKELMEWGCFNDAIMGILAASGGSMQGLLEEMISGGEAYWRLYDATQPILIYSGDDICYSVLDIFAKNLGEALREQGQCVEYFNTTQQDFKEIALYTHRRFKAIIGMQTFLFSVKMNDGRFVHDEIAGRKYNFVFDHPIWLRNHLTETPKGLQVLTLDRNYVEFIKKHYGLEAHFLPPAGREEYCVQKENDTSDREYGISFLGTCGNGFRGKLREMLGEDKQWRRIMNRFLWFMQKNINQAPEVAFQKVLEYYQIEWGEKEFLDGFHKVRWMIYAISQHYRNKVIRTLLEAEIPLHVFGESWKASDFYGNPNLICHKEMLGEESIGVFAKSELSLNIMSWHKDGFTERIANAMLQHSLVVTDKSKYLEENFEDGKEILIFDLENLEDLTKRVKWLLANPDKRASMAEQGYKKAKQFHTWNCRAEKLLKMIEGTTEQK